MHPLSSIVVLGAILAVAACLRGAASCGDLSLDEVWTLWMIDELVRSPLDLVRGSMLHDNNHLLNSAWLLLLGPHRPAILYRLPAIVAGTASVYVAWIFGRSRCAASAVACAGVTAIDHVLVHAGSEARGYGVLSLAVLTAQVAILKGLQALPPPPRPQMRCRFRFRQSMPRASFNNDPGCSYSTRPY